MASAFHVSWKLFLSFSLLFLGLAGCPSTPGKTACKSQTECGAEDVCLQTGVCAKKCTTSADCASDQTCSQAQGCIAAGECGSDRDCSNGKVCAATSQQCKLPCQQSGCSPATTCLDNGHCSSDPFIEGPGTTNQPTDAGCGGELYGATFTPSNVLVVLDRSGSMNYSIGTGARKWDVAAQAVRSVTVAYEDQIRFGLMVFPEVGTQCQPGTLLVTVGDQKGTAIHSALPLDPGPDRAGTSTAFTPLGGALAAAGNVPELRDVNYANYVLLVTDGAESCNGAPVTATQNLAALNIKTYVVGFGSSVDPDTLTKMAQAGGTTRTGALAYYQAEDDASLQAAMTELVRAASGCDYKLKSVPPDVNKMYVYVNGTQVARDTSRQNGWDYSNNNQRITLFGQACSALSSTPGGRVSLVYGCPDNNLVEGPGSGTPGNNSGGGSGGSGSNSGNNGDGGVTIN